VLVVAEIGLFFYLAWWGVFTQFPPPPPPPTSESRLKY
jgi:hypothetical protein